jgi:hypothetical protein
MCRHPSTASWKARSAASKPEQKGVIIPPASATRRASSSRDLSPAQPAPKLMPEQQEARQHEQRPSACKPGEPRTSRRRSGWNDQGPRSTMSRTPVAMRVLLLGRSTPASCTERTMFHYLLGRDRMSPPWPQSIRLFPSPRTLRHGGFTATSMVSWSVPSCSRPQWEIPTGEEQWGCD